MPNAIIYTRVSTDEQADKGYSLKAQKEQLERFCAVKGFNIVAHYQDDHSAKTFDRPEFKKLLEFAKANRHQIDVLLVSKWDRFSRNVTESLNMIQTLKKLGIRVETVEQQLDLDVPENKLILSIYLTAPEVENDRRAMNTAAGMRRAKKEGRWVAHAPIGYKFNRDSTNKPIIVKDNRADLVKEAFTLYATGLYAKEEVRHKLRQKGLKLSRAAFWNMLHNPVYCGLVKVPADKNEPEQLVNGLHEGIVSEELFERVQMVATGKKMVKAKPKRASESLPLRGYLVCSSCGSNLTGSASKGNGGEYYYYHCQPGCKERHRADTAHSSFSMWLDSLSIDPAIAELYLAVMDDIFKTEEGDREKDIKRLEKAAKDKEHMLVKAAEKLVTGDLDKWGYNTLRNNLSKEIAGLKKQIIDLQGTDDAFGTYLKYGMTLLGNLKGYYTDAELEGKQKFLGLIFPEKLVYEGGKYRTKEQSTFLELFCCMGKGFEGSKKKKSGDLAELSRQVARTRIELVSRV